MKKGFTLLEVMVALAVTAVAVIGVFAAILHAMRAQQASRERDTAQYAAKTKMEEIIRADFTTVVATYSGQTFAVVGLPPAKGLAAPGSVVINAADPNLLDIEVRVEWRGAFPYNRATYRSLLTKK